MSTMSVWILIFLGNTTYHRLPTIIDNIATQQECMRIQQIVSAGINPFVKTQCIEIRKAK